MGWIKRNVVFVIVGLVALIALGGAGFYIYQGYSRNSENADTLKGFYNTLDQLAQEQPQPGQAGNEAHDNLKRAQDQEKQLETWIANAGGCFQPIAPIPSKDITSKTYATALNQTAYQLQQEARDNGVALPPQYNFSFQVQSTKLNISSGLNPLAQQLGEVKAIAEILYAARVNNLDAIQRVPVSDDDVGQGAQSDYTDERPITNSLAVITPYVVSFRGFTPELAKVLSGFATSTIPFIVKSVTVQPANASGGSGNNMNMPGMNQQIEPPNSPGSARYNHYAMPGTRAQSPPAPTRGGLQTILKEQLLHVTLKLEIVKLLPKS